MTSGHDLATLIDRCDAAWNAQHRDDGHRLEWDGIDLFAITLEVLGSHHGHPLKSP